MDPVKQAKLNEIPLARRCYSEPPLTANRLSSTITQHTAPLSAHSLQDIKQTQFLKKKLRGGSMVRSSTFPLLPVISQNKKIQDVGFKSINGETQHNEKFPSFGSHPSNNNREKLLAPKQGGLQGRKYQLRSRYLTEIKPSPPKHSISTTTGTRGNLLRKRVQEIGDLDENNTYINHENQDDISELYLNSCQSNLRRLSVITEKSNFSKTSTKTMLFDLEEENDIQNTTTLPGVRKELQNTKRTMEFDKHSKKLQEHLQITGKQFDPLETKATLLSNWFQTLQTG